LCPFACSRSAQSPAAYSRLDVKFAGAVLAGGRSDSSVHRVNLLRGAEGLRAQPLKSPPSSFSKMGRSAHGQRSAAHRNCQVRKCWVGGRSPRRGGKGSAPRVCGSAHAPRPPHFRRTVVGAERLPAPALAGGTGVGQAMALTVRPCSRRTPTPESAAPLDCTIVQAFEPVGAPFSSKRSSFTPSPYCLRPGSRAVRVCSAGR
jgi:hypothetical protein